MKPTVLYVEHKGKWEMTGKVFSAASLSSGQLEDICLHEESGSQEVYTLDSPGGVDYLVLEFLRSSGIHTFHHWRPGIPKLFVSSVESILKYGVRRQWDERDRFFLPFDWWHEYDMIWYSVPWIKKELMLGKELVKRKVELMPFDDVEVASPTAEAPPSPFEQGALF